MADLDSSGAKPSATIQASSYRREAIEGIMPMPCVGVCAATSVRSMNARLHADRCESDERIAGTGGVYRRIAAAARFLAPMRREGRTREHRRLAP